MDKNSVGYAKSSLKKFYKKGFFGVALKEINFGLFEDEAILVEKYFTKKNGHVLVIGCAAGRESFGFLEKGFDVTGVDFVGEMVKIADFKNKKNGLGGEFVVADAMDLPFKKNSFDYVVLIGRTFEFFPRKTNRIKFFKEVKRVLKKPGLFIFDSIILSFQRELFQIIYELFFPFFERNKFLENLKKTSKSPFRYYLLTHFYPVVKKRFPKFIKKYFWSKPKEFFNRLINKNTNLEPGDKFMKMGFKGYNKENFIHFFSIKELKELISISGLKSVAILGRNEIEKPKKFKNWFFKKMEIYFFFVLSK